MPRTVRKTEKEGFVSKRGRPSLAQVAVIDKTILKTAQAMFLSEGYAHTTMEALAAANSMSKSTLYSRYADKADLFNAIVADRISHWRNVQATDDIFGTGTISDRLFKFGSGFLKRMRDPEVFAFDRLIAAESQRFPDLACDFFRQSFLSVIGRVKSELDAEAVRSDWPMVDTEGLATAFISSMIGWVRTMSFVRGVGDEDCQRFVARLVSLTVGGRASW